MNGIVALFLVVIIIGFVVYGLGIGKDFVTDIQASIRESQEKQKDAQDPSIYSTGNFAKDTGTRVCDLRIEFVGILNDINHYGDPINLADERFIEMGSHIKFLTFDYDDRVIVYQWFCRDQASPLSILGWELGKMSLLSFGLDTSQGETIRFKFQGISQNTGKLLFDKNGKGTSSNPLQASTNLPFGSEFPVSFNVPIYLEGVTEDDYTIKYHNDDYSVNGKSIGYTFEYNLQKPSQ